MAVHCIVYSVLCRDAAVDAAVDAVVDAEVDAAADGAVDGAADGTMCLAVRIIAVPLPVAVVADCAFPMAAVDFRCRWSSIAMVRPAPMVAFVALLQRCAGSPAWFE